MPTSIPFVRPMRPESSSRITDLLVQQGRDRADAIARRGAIEADAIRNRGAASAEMWSGIASTIGNVAQAWAEGQEADQARRETERARTEASQITEAIRLTPRDEQGRTDPAAVAREIEHIDPVKALAWWRQADEAKRTTLAAERERGEQIAKAAGSLILDLERAHPTQRQAKWTAARQSAIEGGLPGAEKMPEHYDMGWLRTTFDAARSVESIAREVQTLGEQDDQAFTLSAGEVRYDATGKEIARGPEKTAEPARAGTFEAFIDATAQEKGRPLTHTEILQARGQWTGAGRTEPRGEGGISQAQRAAAIRWRDNETRMAKRVHREATADLDPTRYPEDKTKLEAANRELQDEVTRIDLSYREQIGDTSTASTPPPGAPGAEPPLTVERPPAGTRALAETGGDVPPPPGSVPAPSLGAAPATAAPRGPQGPPAPRVAPPKVGDVVTVRGQRVRVTAIRPDGRIVGEPVP